LFYIHAIMINLKPYHFTLGKQLNKKVIFIQFDKNPIYVTEIKRLTGSAWSQTNKCWYVPDVTEYRKLFQLSTDFEIGKSVLMKISANNQEQLQRLVNQLQLKGYSQSTIRCYSQEFAQFLYYLNEKEVQNCSEVEVKSFLLYCINNIKLKENTLHSRISGIKFYFEKVLFTPKIFLEIPRPKKQLKLPKALNTDEVKMIFEVTKNLKHNTILKLCYGMGLRLSEITNIKISDIDSKTMQVHIQCGKGKKDRYVNLPESLLDQLRDYYKNYKPKEYLFEGQYGGQYSKRSIQKTFKTSLLEARILKKVGIHSLRHSYATHLLENGTDIRFIQELLGHNDIKTTFIYTNVTDKALRKIISPLDYL